MQPKQLDWSGEFCLSIRRRAIKRAIEGAIMGVCDMSSLCKIKADARKNYNTLDRVGHDGGSVNPRRCDTELLPAVLIA